ncbi:MAG: DUF4924 family protein [Bacteroidales bacterium]
MRVALEKKQNNIAEYVLYMWQLEDLLRAFEFNIEELEKNVFKTFSGDDAKRKEIFEWYSNLVQMMEMENIKKTGHLQITKNIVLDLNNLHIQLLKSPEEAEYRELYYKAAPNLYEFQKKIHEKDTGEVEMMFIGLYGLLMMRIQKNDITEETELAMKTFSDQLSLLAKKYHEREEKEKTELI